MARIVDSHPDERTEIPEHKHRRRRIGGIGKICAHRQVLDILFAVRTGNELLNGRDMHRDGGITNTVFNAIRGMNRRDSCVIGSA